MCHYKKLQSNSDDKNLKLFLQQKPWNSYLLFGTGSLAADNAERGKIHGILIVCGSYRQIVTGCQPGRQSLTRCVNTEYSPYESDGAVRRNNVVSFIIKYQHTQTRIRPNRTFPEENHSSQFPIARTFSGCRQYLELHSLYRGQQISAPLHGIAMSLPNADYFRKWFARQQKVIPEFASLESRYSNREILHCHATVRYRLHRVMRCQLGLRILCILSALFCLLRCINDIAYYKGQATSYIPCVILKNIGGKLCWFGNRLI